MDEKVNILMVDDQPSRLLSYEVILGELDENLIRANSGKEALELLLNNDVAVVLIDVNMPELDGFELADMIRRHPRFQSIAIVFISGVHLADTDRLKGYEHGGMDYIFVPVVPALLRAKVRVFVDLHRKTQQLENLHLELARLSSRMIVLQDNERRRIARELHDSLGQELSAAKIIIDASSNQTLSPESRNQKMNQASVLIDNSIQQIRTISYLLHPPLLDEAGLYLALRAYIEGITQRSGIEIFTELPPQSFPRLPPELEIAIFRIVQEGLTNVYRHSGAGKAWVTVAQDENQVMLIICDDGKGIGEQSASFRPGSLGVGIAGMRQRVKEFGGEFEIRNTNPGTLVKIAIPIQSHASVP
jgi:signal transduction histidine kinase